ncbi:MAG: undecaprenyl-phosphate galactose phosphotransferase WbaP [Spirochaetaceae bacterium]|jgi:Undecaprenyl-phosphate galactose phosphotransferase WbaP|nr:undecaprenyl-phosphate galactose phosphotransferase WbaP [Spirochaetaceae bacterium]
MTLTDFDIWYRSRYRRTSSAITTTGMIVSDLIGCMLSFGAGFFFVNLYDIHLINFKSFVTYWPYLPVFILIFQVNNLYPGVFLAPAEELRHLVVSSFLTHGGIILSRYIEDKEFDAISAAFIISFACSPVILLNYRALAHRFLVRTRLGGIPAVIFGAGKTGKMLVDRLLNSKKAGYTPVLILDNGTGTEEMYHGVPIIRDTMLGPEVVGRYNIKMAIVTSLSDPQDWNKTFRASVAAFRYHVLIPKFSSFTDIWMSVRDFDGILGFVTSHKLKMPWNLRIKRFVDLGASLLMGLILLPLLLFIAFLVKATSPGPALFGHTRIGQGGTRFKAYKFRSMAKNAEELLQKLLEADPQARAEWEANRKIKNDPRITKLGKFLRQTSLDEFPQLINIIKGEMSLVGPRPIVEDEAAKYGEDFNRIFSVKPGLSGLWQVSGRSDTDYNERVAFDMYYLQSWSVWLDLWVLYKTVWVVLKGKGAY